MGDVVRFRLQPIIKVQQGPGGGYYVAIRPAPPDVISLRFFPDANTTAAFVDELHAEHGWPIRPDPGCELYQRFDGAA
ncbi:MAG TPA: hypothetical protein VNH53_08960 [Sphingomicrobium sp.]|jgi:hypothetical protein|nr:hypothetical protein [Sphingomicrobium sp.]